MARVRVRVRASLDVRQEALASAEGLDEADQPRLARVRVRVRVSVRARVRIRVRCQGSEADGARRVQPLLDELLHARVRTVSRGDEPPGVRGRGRGSGTGTGRFGGRCSR